MGKPTELCRGGSQLSCEEGLSLPGSVDSHEQTIERFPHGNVNASEAQLFGEFAFCRENYRLTLGGPGMGLPTGAVRAGSLPPWEVGTSIFTGHQGRSVEPYGTGE